MLRRKLLLILFLVTALLLTLALTAVWSMRSIHQQFEQVAHRDAATVDRAQRLATAVSQVELELLALQSGQQRYLDALIDAVEQLHTLTDQLSAEPELAVAGHLPEQVAAFERHVAALAVTRDPGLVNYHHSQGLAAARELRVQILAISGNLQGQMQGRLTALTRSFRWLVLGLAAGFVLVINASILLLLRSMEMVLRPMDRLVAASRHLAAERFDHRVELPGRDEFHELATAFNQLGRKLQDNEQRKIETLHQVATTLNHELNNAIAIIDLQLRLVRRQAGSDQNLERPLQEIQSSLQRMTGVVESLKHVRRIVLTDYLEGVRMLDLSRSIEPGGSDGSGDGASAQA